MTKKSRPQNFIAASTPPDVEPTPREQFLAANPKARAVQDAFARDFAARLAEFQHGALPLGTLFHAMIDKAEQARQIGIVLLEFTEQLPGKKLTIDLYHQMKHLFVDPQGQCLALPLLEWFMRVARSHADPIADIQTALKWNQPLLLATGEAEFQLETERPPAQRIPPKDEWARLNDWLGNPELEQLWPRLRNNPAYFPDGKLRPDLRAIMAAEWSPKFKVLDELRDELGI